MRFRRGTKSQAEREDEAADRMVKKSPKKKPPRYDRRNNRLEEKDPDLDEKDKDLSMKNASARIAFEQAVCRLAMQFRGIAPDLHDVTIIKSKVAGNLSDPHFWPELAEATFEHLDNRYRHARYRRVAPTINTRTFEMAEPLNPRPTEDSTWPVWTRSQTKHPSDLTENDLDRIIQEAAKHVDPDLLGYRRDMAFCQALDIAIGTLMGGIYQNTVDAPTYLELLNRLSMADYDLAREVYVPTEVDEERRAPPRPVFDPSEYWGRPADSFIDPGVTEGENWRKIFEDPGPLQRDADEPYMDGFKNPSV